MRRYLALIACAALALAGCASLPTSSPPAPFDVSARDGSGIQFSAEGPSDGSDAATLVSDFLLACAAGPQDDYATARLFLVYDTDTAPAVSATSENASRSEVTVSVLGVASIDQAGVLTRSNGATVSRTFSLVREDGQWRIDAPENMILISRAALTASYTLANLYFPSTDGTELVADPRWYPSRRLASHLLAGLVDGPRADLDSVVANAIPAGATLPSHGVEVNDGVARVELNASMPPGESARESLQWELTRTLTQAADVSQVSVSLTGEVMEVAALPTPPSYSLDTLVGAGSSGVGIVSSSGLTSRASATDALNPTASPVDSSLVAWSGADGVYAERAGTAVAFVPGQAPLGPSIDRYGWVWGPASSSSTLSVGGGADGAFDVAIESESAGEIRAVRVSPDGSRALVVRGSTPSAWVGVIERGPGGRPQAVRSLEQVFLDGAVIDASWTTSTGLAVAVRGGSGEDDQLVTMTLGGLPSSLPLPIRVSSMSAGASSASVVIVGTDDAGKKQVLVRSGALWQNLAVDVSSARYAG